MLGLFEFLKSPQENFSGTKSVKDFLLTLLLYFSLIFITFIIFFIFLYLDKAPKLSRDMSHLPLLFLLFVPPMLEELAFRLPLKRTTFNQIVGFCVLSFLLISRFLFDSIYSTHLLFYRILIGLAVGLIIYFCIRKISFTCSYTLYFYFFAILFGMIHIFNFYPGQYDFAEIMHILSYGILKIPCGIIWGYIRINYGFFYAYLIHFLNNFFPFVLDKLFPM